MTACNFDLCVTSSLTICFFVLEDSGPSAATCFRSEGHTCSQPAAFPIPFTQCTRKTFYVYTIFVIDLLLVKFEAVNKTSWKT